MPVSAPIVIGPVNFVYIDIDASDPTSALVKVIRNGVDTFKIAQSGTIQTTGKIIQSALDGMSD